VDVRTDRASFLPALLALLSLLPVAPANAAEPQGPHNRAEAIKIIGELRRIVTPRGIERLEKVKIGGIEQWVSIRGADRRNPVLLYLHGGPGFAMMPMSWYFQRGWEEYFTVVEWDQRGAGKTYAANDPAEVTPTLTLPRMVADTEEMVVWLRRELHKEKIFVLGHSFGSYLGLELAQRHPEWLHAYIGLGQLIDGLESERRGWAFAMGEARKAGNAEAIQALEAIAPYAAAGKKVPLPSLYVQRRWLTFYGGAVYGRTSSEIEGDMAQLAPEYTDADLDILWKAADSAEEKMLAEALSVDFSRVARLRCPLVLFSGRYDYNVSASLAAEWFARLRAPSKTLVWFERSAHMIVTEEPGKALLALVEKVRPIAARAGDVAP
jgi:pimeloyl-ACP methyl ester carboxylesterase